MQECTVVVTHKQKLLVAAHCRISKEWHRFTVYLGSYKKGEGIIGKVAKIEVMDGYVSPSKGKDLAVIYLTEPIDFDFPPFFQVETIDIADANEMPPSGAVVTAAGFGLWKPTSRPSLVLRCATFQTLGPQECKERGPEMLPYHICSIDKEKAMGLGDTRLWYM
uniref:Peptidase S1 domain-containing protein n=1 Tax=Panagrolaimus davidi TaxID=227884 RepID=A0A914Q6T0_9BILA